MSGNVTFALSAMVCESPGDDKRTHMTISVFVSRDGKHVESIDLARIEPVTLEDNVDVDVVERYALVMSRVMARRLASVYNDVTEAEKLHSRQSYEVAE